MLSELKSEFSFLGDIRGKGLLMGIEFNIDHENPEGATLDVIGCARDKGLLILRSGKNVLRIAPALTITEEELKTGIGILRDIFKDL